MTHASVEPTYVALENLEVSRHDEVVRRGLLLFALLGIGVNLLGLIFLLINPFGSPLGVELGRGWWVFEHLLHIGMSIAMYTIASRAPEPWLWPSFAVFFVLIGTFNTHADLVAFDPAYPHQGLSWNCMLLVVIPIIVPIGAWRMVAVEAAVVIGTCVATGVWIANMELTDSGAANLEVAVFSFLAPVVMSGIGGSLTALHLEQRFARIRRLERHLHRLGHYELVERIGQGGMGEVWRARHDVLAREAAVKLIRARHLDDFLDEETQERLMRRFVREARLTAQLTSPHTVHVYDCGLSNREQIYYAMELLDGIDLGTAIKQDRPMPSDRVRQIMLQACDSLAEAHDFGLVHRDIKPANLFLAHVGDRWDHVKILDFGLVLPRNADHPEVTRITKTGMVQGTPAYMSPEQAKGEEIDGRSDIYALGVTAYLLLTRRLPHEGESSYEIIRSHLEEDPAPPSMRVDSDVDPGLEAVIMTCLQRDRDRRFRSARELRAALETLSITPRWTQLDAQEWARMMGVGHAADAPFATGTHTTIVAGESEIR